ncbi:FAD/NAD(P)-binding protein [Solirhodobacter olei]|uniref:FAD/NAD(P)-binding protein n=1 Tax=Solirhodobacter olei TaxID=2493082 RepID=UPI001F4E63E8|nr:FAD/NAD(P)-binding protein [Solirhodobacter olei]
MAAPLPTPDPMLPRRYRVTRAKGEIAGTATVELAPIDGAPMTFSPGQFNMLYAFGVGEIPVSISGDPARPGQLTHTTRDVGLVSKAIVGLKEGDMLGIRGPFGSAWPIEAAAGRHALFIAGGLGLAPLRPAIYHVLNNRADYAGLTLVYGARSPDELLYAEEISTWKSRLDTEVEVTVDHARPGWTGRVGVVTTALPHALAGTDPATIEAFICGPEIMMRFTLQALEAAGVSSDHCWVSMERNMKCALGFCGHCQFGGDFICKDGPVFRHDTVAARLGLKEL